MLRAPRSLKTHASAPDGPAVNSVGKGADRNCSSVTGGGAGLTARGRLNASGDNETTYLAPLDEIIATGKVPAEVLLSKYHGEWGGDISRVYEESF